MVAGERVRLVSAYGSAVLPVRLSDRVKPGELFATFHMADVFLNRVIGTTCDPVTMPPEDNVTAVRLERAYKSEADRLRRRSGTPRFGVSSLLALPAQT